MIITISVTTAIMELPATLEKITIAKGDTVSGLVVPISSNRL